MKKLAKSLSVLMIFAMLIALVPQAAAEAATSYSLSAKSKTLFVGGCTGTTAAGSKAAFKASYTVKINGIKKTDKVTYKSNNASIAKVSKKGKVTAVANGKTKIVVKIKTKAGKTYTRNFTATVKSNAATVTISGIPEDKTFTAGQTYTLSAEALDSKGAKSTDELQFSVDDTSIATIDAAGKLKVLKAGEFTITARAYQAAKYPGTTASEEVKVKAIAAKKELAVRQLSATKVELTVPEAIKTIAASDILATKTAGTVATSESLRSAKLSDTDDTKVIVELWNKMTAGDEYNFTYGGEKVSLTAKSCEPKDVKTIEMVTKSMVYGTYNTLEYIGYTADGIECGNQSDLWSYITITINPADGDYNLADRKLILTNKGNFTIKLTYKVDYLDGTKVLTNEFTKDYVITGIDKAAATVVSTEYTVGAIGSSVFDVSGFKPNYEIAANDEALGRNTDLVFRVKYSDKTVVTNDSDVFDYVSSDSSIVIVSGKTLKPINPGKVSIVAYESGTKNVVGVFEVTVVAERKPVSATISLSKNYINTVATDIGEKLVVSAKVIDNFGKSFPEANVELKVQGSASGTATLNTGAVTGVWSGDAYVMTAPAPAAITGEGTVAVYAEATYGTTTIKSGAAAFTCKSVATTETPDSIKLFVENAAGLPSVNTEIMNSKSLSDYNLNVCFYSYKGNYQISSKTTPKFDDASNYSANATEYFYQVLGGSSAMANKSGYTDNFSTGVINPLASKSGAITKLPVGTYIVKLYKVVTDSTKKVTAKTAENTATANFTITDTQPTLSVTQLKNKISSMDEATIKSEAAFSVVYGSSPSKVLLSETVPADANLSFDIVTGSTAIAVKAVNYKVYLSDMVNYIVVSKAHSATLEK